MATIKGYTNIEQSKKLAEILPHESADQTWERIAIAGANLDVPEELQYKHNGDIPFQYYSGICAPCWSLAALLNIIPNYKLSSEHNYHTCTAETSFGKETVGWFDNSVDACVAMIERLHELKML